MRLSDRVHVEQDIEDWRIRFVGLKGKVIVLMGQAEVSVSVLMVKLIWSAETYHSLDLKQLLSQWG